MTPARGNPLLNLRLDPELTERAQEAFPAVVGRSGGLSLAIRRLLHLALDEPMPRQFGEIGRVRAIDELEEVVRQLEAAPSESGELGLATEAARALLAKELDAVDLLRIRALLGRLAVLERPLEEPEQS